MPIVITVQVTVNTYDEQRAKLFASLPLEASVMPTALIGGFAHVAYTQLKHLKHVSPNYLERREKLLQARAYASVARRNANWQTARRWVIAVKHLGGVMYLKAIDEQVGKSNSILAQWTEEAANATRFPFEARKTAQKLLDEKHIFNVAVTEVMATPEEINADTH